MPIMAIIFKGGGTITLALGGSKGLVWAQMRSVDLSMG